MAKDYVMVKIDTDRMTDGEKVAEKLRKGKGGGIPWMVIEGPDGRARITSDGEQGNIGCPVEPEEVAHFQKMIATTKKRLTDDDVQFLDAALEKHAEKYRRPRR